MSSSTTFGVGVRGRHVGGTASDRHLSVAAEDNDYESSLDHDDDLSSDDDALAHRAESDVSVSLTDIHWIKI